MATNVPIFTSDRGDQLWRHSLLQVLTLERVLAVNHERFEHQYDERRKRTITGISLRCSRSCVGCDSSRIRQGSLHFAFKILNSRMRSGERLNGLLPSPFRARKRLRLHTVRTNEPRVRMSYATQLTEVLGRDIHGTVLRPSRLVPAYLSVILKNSTVIPFARICIEFFL